MAEASSSHDPPYTVILEQPAPYGVRFRYQVEGRFAGSILGKNSTEDFRTFPTLQVKNYHGSMVVLVSCVTADGDHRPHPHNLVGRDCINGVCKTVSNADMPVVFKSLGIQCEKRQDIERSLQVRSGLLRSSSHAQRSNRPLTFDLHAVRLCFRVYLEGSDKGKFTVPLKKVVSDIIYNKKSSMMIMKLSRCNAYCDGGHDVIILCEKVTKDDVKIRFYDDDGWEGFGEFEQSDVHKQVAISFKTPRYKAADTKTVVGAHIQLLRPSDGTMSCSLRFEFLPMIKGKNEFERIPTTISEIVPSLPNYAPVSINLASNNFMPPGPSTTISNNFVSLPRFENFLQSSIFQEFVTNSQINSPSIQNSSNITPNINQQPQFGEAQSSIFNRQLIPMQQDFQLLNDINQNPLFDLGNESLGLSQGMSSISLFDDLMQ